MSVVKNVNLLVAKN